MSFRDAAAAFSNASSLSAAGSAAAPEAGGWSGDARGDAERGCCCGAGSEAETGV